MGNCLVTKLKSIVDNTNLNKLGYIQLTVNNPTTSDYFSLHQKSGGNSVLSIVSGPDGGQIAKRNGSTIGTTMPLDNSLDQYYFTVQGIYVVEISDKYSLTILECPRTALDISDLQYSDLSFLRCLSGNVYGNIECVNADNIILSSNKITGDLSKMSLESTNILNIQQCYGVNGSTAVFLNNTSLSTIAINGISNIDGDIANFVGCTSLTNLQIPGTSISGSLASLINNGAKAIPNLSILIVTSTPNLTKNAEDIATLRNLGVSVTA